MRFSEFERLIINPETLSRTALANLQGAEIESGQLAQPEEKNLYFLLENSVVGDVDFVPKTLDLFSKVIIHKTDFDGFRFENYRNILEKIDWEITSDFGYNGIDVTPSPEDREITYLQARRGADEVGDKYSASNLFIKELMSRRDRYLAQYRNSDGLREKIRYCYLTIANLLYEKSSQYGENSARVMGISLVTIIFCAILYPLTGGIKRPTGTIRFGPNMSGLEVWNAFLDSLYFSIVTFTTLGYGDIQPASPVSALIASIESLFGAILIALLIFVMGRSVKW